MKILCPTDFSNTSCNAVQWAFEFLKGSGPAELEIVHCLNQRNRSDMFIKMNDVLLERAILDLDILKGVLDPGSKSEIHIEPRCFDTDPKTFVPSYAKRIDADLIVIGSNGLTPVKDMTFGSVAEAVARISEVPVMIIPPDLQYHSPNELVLTVGQDEIKKPEILSHVSKLLQPHLKKIFALHVERTCPEAFPQPAESQLKSELVDFDLEFSCREFEDSITTTINAFAESVGGDITCLIHHPRGWLGRLLEPSITKEAIYDLKRPLLILKDD